MATLTVYGNTSGYIVSGDNTYSSARAGTGAVVVAYDNNSNLVVVGEHYRDTELYNSIYQAFLSYNTSSLGSSAQVTSVKEEVYLGIDETGTDFVEEVRTLDWGTTLTSADWIAGANLGNYTLLSSKTVSPSYGYNEFSDSTNFRNAVNTTGYTRLFHSSKRQRDNAQPYLNVKELVHWYAVYYTGTTHDPKLTIEYSLITNKFFFLFT